MPDAWTVLGLAPGATLDDARRAYLIRSQLVHPDRHQGAPAPVLAEADRAMRELNDAWEEVQRLAGDDEEGRGEAGPAAPRQGDEITTAADAVAWIISRLADAAGQAGDPLAGAERVRLAAPATEVPHSRSFDRWVQRRRVTLRQATAADAGEPDARARWARAVRLVAEATPVPVVVYLLGDRTGH